MWPEPGPGVGGWERAVVALGLPLPQPGRTLPTAQIFGSIGTSQFPQLRTASSSTLHAAQAPGSGAGAPASSSKAIIKTRLGARFRVEISRQAEEKFPYD